VDLLGGFGDEDVISTGIETNVFATDKALPALSVPPAVAATTDGKFIFIIYQKNELRGTKMWFRVIGDR
jgi:hypothetical protein